MSLQARAAVAALAVAVLLGVVLALLQPAPDQEARLPQADPDPAAYQVSEVIEEARRITREAAP